MDQQRLLEVRSADQDPGALPGAQYAHRRLLLLVLAMADASFSRGRCELLRFEL